MVLVFRRPLFGSPLYLDPHCIRIPTVFAARVMKPLHDHCCLICSQHRLEDLFLIEEDVKHEDEKEDDLEETAEALVAAQALIQHPEVSNRPFLNLN